jgi:hypothetical protein
MPLAAFALPRLMRMLGYLLLETLVDTLEIGPGVRQAEPCSSAAICCILLEMKATKYAESMASLALLLRMLDQLLLETLVDKL